uniref:Uncharacterized protein n=1 Tax=Trypanosoma congolense (strain IL3000) TaxID=1068625 RepID=G0UT70_TRYCI|nr:hypothetical protein, unlikely [Trypanosoma congolense IL3000]
MFQSPVKCAELIHKPQAQKRRGSRHPPLRLLKAGPHQRADCGGLHAQFLLPMYEQRHDWCVVLTNVVLSARPTGSPRRATSKPLVKCSLVPPPAKQAQKPGKILVAKNEKRYSSAAPVAVLAAGDQTSQAGATRL